MKTWDPKFGDRRQEIVLIGINFDKEQVTKDLNKCLLTEKEMADPDQWSEFEDPLEEWEDEIPDEWID